MTTTSTTGRLHTWADAGIALGVGVGAVARAMVGGVPVLLMLALLAACLVLVLRRHHPALTLGVLLAATAVTALAGYVLPPVFVGVEIALYTYAVRTTRARTIPAALLTGAVTFLAARSAASGPLTEPGTLIVVVWTALAAAIGDAVRNHRAYVSALAERAQRAEETRDAVARARVTEERVRIARELHDVVAHNLAVISVHSGLAQRTLQSAPDQAAESLGHVQAAARTALDELGAVLRVLRTESSEDESRPAPGLADLDDLVGSFAGVGLAVRTSITGRPGALDPACDLTAYRVVQESLTNAQKHGGEARALVRIVHGADGVEVVVTNPVSRPAAELSSGLRAEGDDAVPRAGTGNGLLGMRERVTSVGGTMTAGTGPDGTYRVTAHIPAAPPALEVSR